MLEYVELMVEKVATSNATVMLFEMVLTSSGRRYNPHPGEREFVLSTVRQFQKTCWKASFLATRKARSLEQQK